MDRAERAIDLDDGHGGIYMAGSRHWRATVDAVDAETTTAVLTNAHEVQAWLLKHGPVRLRFRWYDKSTPDRRTGQLDVAGTKGGRVTVALVGYDEQPTYARARKAAQARAKGYPFRMLTDFGSRFGQAGRVWLSRASLQRILRDGGVAHGIAL